MDETPTLVCTDCGDVVPAPDLTEGEIREWKANHTEQTGHDSWRAALLPGDVDHDA